jgi:hypothetical protein
MNVVDAPGIELHEDAFYKFFQPYRHSNTTYECFGGIGIETFGADRELAYALDSDFVWTVMDGTDNDRLYTFSGCHCVNRVAYLVTKRPHHGLPIGFRCDGRPSWLTPLGLRRQISQLTRYMATYSPMTAAT